MSTHADGPRPRRTVGLAAAGIAGIVVVVVVVVVALMPGGPGGPGATPTPEPLLPGEATCPIPAELANRVVFAESSGGDDPNDSGGAAVLCDRTGTQVAATATVMCVWSADRSHLRRLSMTFGDPDHSPTVVELHPEPQRPITLGLFSDGTSYRSSDPLRVGGATSGQAKGAIGFRDVPAVQRPGDEPGTGSADGVVRWACDDPPEPVAHLTDGTVQLVLDAVPGPFGQAWATCAWAEVDGRPVLTSVETYTDALTVDGSDVGISLARDGYAAGDVPGIYLWVSHPDRGGLTFSGSFEWPLAASPDMGTATVRFRGFAVDAGGEDLDLPDLAAGTLSWGCAKPAGALPPPQVEPDPGEVVPTRSGTGTIRLGAPLDETLDATVTCWIYDPGPNTDPEAGAVGLQIERIEMRTTYGDELLILTDLDFQLVLERIGPDGRVLGEYVPIDAGAWFSEPVDLPPHDVALGRFAFEPVGAPYVPLGGAGGPAQVALTVTVDCRAP